MRDTEQQAATAYALIGGQATVDRLVDSFYDRMDSLPDAAVIRAMHTADLTDIRAVLKQYLGEWLGGPKRYTSERGHPMLRARHLPFPIGNAERDAWMLCMNGALDATVAQVDVREHIRTALSNLAGHMRNLPEQAP
jgi:hemoglobin